MPFTLVLTSLVVCGKLPGVALPGTALCQQLMARVYGVIDEKQR